MPANVGGDEALSPPHTCPPCALHDEFERASSEYEDSEDEDDFNFTLADMKAGYSISPSVSRIACLFAAISAREIARHNDAYRYA